MLTKHILHGSQPMKAALANHRRALCVVLLLPFMMFCLAGCSSTKLAARKAPEPNYFFPFTQTLIRFVSYWGDGSSPSSQNHKHDLHSFCQTVGGVIVGVPIHTVLGIADILLLPVSIGATINYKLRPPLSLYIIKNDIIALEKALKSGRDPNKRDDRQPNAKPYPIETARMYANMEAVKVLIDYGAKPTQDFVSLTFHPNISQKTMEIILYALQNGNKELLSKDPHPEIKNHIIYDWVRGWERYCESTERMTQLAEIISLFLDAGCPVNTLMPSNDSAKRITALDIVLDPDYAKGIDKSPLVSMLRSHGALTSQEMLEKHPEMLPLRTDGLDIDPIFQPVIDQLKLTHGASYLRLSTTYPGINGPVLVIDDDERQTIHIHRRKTSTEWNQETEPFDIPKGFLRVVLTPRGIKVPSRLTNLPKSCFIIEKWFTLPAFEVFLEINPVNKHNINFIQRSGILANLLEGNIQWNDLCKVTEYFNFGLEYKLVFNHDKNQYRRLWRKYKKYFSTAKKISENHSISGFLMVGNDYPLKLAFDTHERQLDKIHYNEGIAPYPDEILAIIHINEHIEDEINVNIPRGKNGTGYWNHIAKNVGSRRFFEIYYGDEVSNETLNKFQLFLVDLLTTYSKIP